MHLTYRRTYFRCVIIGNMVGFHLLPKYRWWACKAGNFLNSVGKTGRPFAPSLASAPKSPSRAQLWWPCAQSRDLSFSCIVYKLLQWFPKVSKYHQVNTKWLRREEIHPGIAGPNWLHLKPKSIGKKEQCLGASERKPALCTEIFHWAPITATTYWGELCILDLDH